MTPEVVLGSSIALLGRLAVPLHRLGIALGQPPRPFCIHDAEVGLGICMTLLGCLAVPLHRLGIVPGHTPTIRIHDAEVVLTLA